MIDIMQVKVCAAPARPASALPISRPGAVFARGESAAPRTRSVAAERILLIEDDFLVATQIEAALIDAGFAIAGVGSSADEAIQLASSRRPVLCVMDIRLAGSRDGIEAAIQNIQGAWHPLHLRHRMPMPKPACAPKRPFRSAGCKSRSR